MFWRHEMTRTIVANCSFIRTCFLPGLLREERHAGARRGLHHVARNQPDFRRGEIGGGIMAGVHLRVNVWSTRRLVGGYFRVGCFFLHYCLLYGCHLLISINLMNISVINLLNHLVNKMSKTVETFPEPNGMFSFFIYCQKQNQQQIITSKKLQPENWQTVNQLDT